MRDIRKTKTARSGAIVRVAVSLLALAGIVSAGVARADNEYKGYTLRVKLIGGVQYEALYTRIPLWEKQTGAKVEIVSRKSHFELDRELKQDIASNHIDYCVSSNHTNFAAQYPIFRDLKGLFPADYLAQFAPNLLKQSEVKGHLVQIPRSTDVEALYYNKVAFDDPANQAAYRKQFGKALAPPTNYAEFTQQAKFFTKAPNFYGTQFPGKDEALTGTFYSLLVANGGQLLDAKMHPVFNSPIGVKTLDWFVNLYKDGAVPKGAPSYVWDDLGNNFAAGKVALDMDWPGFASFYNDPKTSKLAGQVGVVRAPLGAGNRRPGWSGSHSFSITKTCDRPEVAASFIQFLTSHDSQMVEARLGTIPSRLDAQRDAAKEFDAKHDAFMANAIAVFSTAAKEDSFTPPRIAQWNEISNALWPELQKAIIGDKTSTQALNDAAKRVSDIMQDAADND
ncbi:MULTISPECIES: sugar ABC transporter substrate-binding protein [Paraburkholderia]|uniref:ABC transporter substrate-binding protein n=1 Tax=Paraburkholderia TaxID=1822464 RepID=UPI00224DF1DD|nr:MULTISPECIES: sugar ABC transporter substrate-binding protein [Paraburkholderia]MCX4166026.1 sugar ABC transporter substrate-binding protein [Paraburkholderia megapolitana]MDN7161516.1 sugar ABC transporter substrate-binding protein [Paraburkholderia sp. CHISQ3]MDQ6498564.1 sugar ABC transporter substrate-binding protein [Paraburkholderia megapolitana]